MVTKQNQETGAPFNRPARIFLAATALVALALSSACSPKGLWGDNIDKQVQDTRNYHGINKGCAGMDLSSSWIDVKMLRHMVKCFNANGGMPETAALVEYLDDESLDPIVTAINRYFISDRWLYKLEQSYYTLEKRKTLTRTLDQLGAVLDNEQFLTSGIALLKTGYSSDKNAVAESLSLLGGKLTDARVADALDVGLNAVRSRAFASIQLRLAGHRSTRDLTSITAGLLDFVRFQKPGRVQFVPELHSLLKSGDAFRVYDALFPNDPDLIRKRTAGLAGLLQVTLDQNAAPLDHFGSLFRALNSPVSCMLGTQSMPNAALVILRDMAQRHGKGEDVSDYLQRENPLTLFVASPFCQLPQEIRADYPALLDLAAAGAAPPMSDVVLSLFDAKKDTATVAAQPALDFFVRALSDWGADGNQGLKSVLPLMLELTERDAWKDLFLLASMLKIDNRQDIVDAVDFFMESRPSLGGRTVYDVLRVAISQADVGQLNALVNSMSAFVNRPDPLLAPALEAIRDAFHSNDVHPGIEILRQFMTDASMNRALFDTVFRISETEQFRRALREVSVMARADDGRLEDLLGSFVAMFHKFAERARMPINELPVPSLPAKVWHDWAADDLNDLRLTPSRQEFDACRRIDLLRPFEEYLVPGFDGLDDVAACFDADGKHKDVSEAVKFLQREKREDGRSYLQYAVDWVKGLSFPLDPTHRQLGDLSDRVMTAVRDGRMDRFIAILPYWLTKEFRAEGELFRGPVLEPLMDVLKPIAKDKDAMQALSRLEVFGASVLRRPDIQATLSFGENIWDAKPSTGLSPAPRISDRAHLADRLAHWVENKECGTLPPPGPMREAEKSLRIEQIMDEYENAIANVATPRNVGLPLPIFDLPRHWEKARFMDGVRGLLQIFLLENETYSAPEALLRFVRSFGLRPGQGPDQEKHFTVQELRKWIEDRSNDYRPVAVAYPASIDGGYGSQRRVRLLNSMDRLELLLMAADIDMPGDDINMAEAFLPWIGQAWGDEPPSVWPPEIQERYPQAVELGYCDGKVRCPQTLRAAVDDLVQGITSAGIVSFPDLPKCVQNDDPNDDSDVYEPSSDAPVTEITEQVHRFQAGMYNFEQVKTVLYENLPDAKGPHAGGLRIVRNLLFALSPTKTGDVTKNILAAVHFVRLGMMRQLANAFYALGPSAEGMDQILIALVQGSSSPHISRLLNDILVNDPKQQLAERAVEVVFDALDKPEQRANLKRLGYYALASTEGLAGNRPVSTIIDPLLQAATPLVEEHYDYLTRHIDVLEDLAESGRIPELMQSLFESRDYQGQARLGALLRDTVSDLQRGKDLFSILVAVDKDGSAEKEWNRFVDRMDVMTEDAAYKAIDVEPVVRDALHFIEGKADTADGRAAALSLLEMLAQRAEAGDIHNLVALAGHQPKQSYKTLSLLGTYSENGGLDRFLDLMGQALKSQR